MTDYNNEWLMEQPAATVILAAYADRETRLPKRPAKATVAVVPAGAVSENESVASEENGADESENADAWVPRIAMLDGIEPAQLSQLHGGLIARGFLKYELFGRQIGLRYRLTPDGRRAAEQPVTTPSEAAA